MPITPSHHPRSGGTERGPQVSLCLQPILHIVSLLAATREVEVVRAAGDVALGRARSVGGPQGRWFRRHGAAAAGYGRRRQRVPRAFGGWDGDRLAPRSCVARQWSRSRSNGRHAFLGHGLMLPGAPRFGFGESVANRSPRKRRQAQESRKKPRHVTTFGVRAGSYPFLLLAEEAEAWTDRQD